MKNKQASIPQQAEALAAFIDSPGWRLVAAQIALRLHEADEALHNAPADEVVNIARQQTACRLYSQVLNLAHDMLANAYQTIAEAGSDQQNKE